MGLSLRAGERPRVGIGADQFCSGVSEFRADGEISGAATDFEDTLPVGEFCLRDERVVDAVHPQQAGKQVIARKQHVVTGCGQIIVPVPETRATEYGRCSVMLSMVNPEFKEEWGDPRGK